MVDNAPTHKSEIIRVYFPPDGNCLLRVVEHCLRNRNVINVITCGKQPQLQWLNMDEARVHCTGGIGTWAFAGAEPPGQRLDVVLACVGDVPTLKTMAAAHFLRKHVPALRFRVVNVVDLCSLMRADVHPHGLDDITFETYFPRGVPVVFTHHVRGARRTRASIVRGYVNEGTTTTPFDMAVSKKPPYNKSGQVVGPDDVVPMAVEGGRFELDRLQIGVGDAHAGRVGVGVEQALDLHGRGGRGVGDQIDDDKICLAEEPVPDPARRVPP